MIVYTTVFLAILTFEVLLFLLLTSMPSLGTWGKDAVDACTKTPMLDWLLSFIILVPWLIGGLTVRWEGIVASLLAQVLAMQLWIFYHEFLNRNVAPGSRIARFHSQRIGWWRNHLALWVTSIIVPVFFLIRFSEVFVYPMLIWLLGFPKYKHSDWSMLVVTSLKDWSDTIWFGVFTVTGWRVCTPSVPKCYATLNHFGAQSNFTMVKSVKTVGLTSPI